jgi:hypothetical protein
MPYPAAILAMSVHLFFAIFKRNPSEVMQRSAHENKDTDNFLVTVG